MWEPNRAEVAVRHATRIRGSAITKKKQKASISLETAEQHGLGEGRASQTRNDHPTVQVSLESTKKRGFKITGKKMIGAGPPTVKRGDWEER